MDRVVSPFSHGDCASFAFNRHTVSCEPQDNHDKTVTFPLNPLVSQNWLPRRGQFNGYIFKNTLK